MKCAVFQKVFSNSGNWCIVQLFLDHEIRRITLDNGIFY